MLVIIINVDHMGLCPYSLHVQTSQIMKHWPIITKAACMIVWGPESRESGQSYNCCQ